MKVLKATIEQKQIIESQTKHPNVIEFKKDAKGNWFVNKEVCSDPKFTHIKELEHLEEIEYTPTPATFEG